MDDYGQNGETIINVPFETGFDNTDADGDGGPDFATGNVNYVTGVLWQEIAPVGDVPNWPAESIKAMAIAARTLGYNWCGIEFDAETGHRIMDDNNKQHYNPHRPDSAISAAEKERYRRIAETTIGVYMTYGEDDFDAKYRSYTGSYTLEDEPAPPHRSVEDPVGANYDPIRSPGMAQINAAYWASGHDPTPNDRFHPRWSSYLQILTHYYTEIHLKDEGGNQLTPAYRWVPLSVDWHTADNRAPIMYHDQSYEVTFRVQNSGTTVWPGTGQIYLWYHGWDQARGQNHTQSLTQAADPGEVVEETITLYPPVAPCPGTPYRLRFEMFLVGDHGDIGFSENETGRPRFTYDVTVCVDGPCQIFLPMILRNHG